MKYLKLIGKIITVNVLLHALFFFTFVNSGFFGWGPDGLNVFGFLWLCFFIIPALMLLQILISSYNLMFHSSSKQNKNLVNKIAELVYLMIPFFVTLFLYSTLIL